MAIIRKNERSWAIEIISQINQLAATNDLYIKRAGGESTISVNNVKRMFPDVILYGDRELTSILQGWELKMPDVPITDEAFVRDAQRKARVLGLDSCVIWNFTHVKLFILNHETDEFDTPVQWENLKIVNRDDVAAYRKEWEQTLKEVVLAVNGFLVSHTIKRTTIESVLSQTAIYQLVNENKMLVADHLRQEATKDILIKVELEQWWKSVQEEYRFDETNMYEAYAKTLIIHWAYRILFAHLIKRQQNAALPIDTLDYDTTPQEAEKMFQQITSKADFYNIFEGMRFVELLPPQTWESLVSLSLFLRGNDTQNINQRMVQNILEGTVRQARRELNGQYTTPKVLARMLARMTIHNMQGDCLDPCCGTGTIPHEIIELKRSAIGTSTAVTSTWASDKYSLPLQIANLSMTSVDTINLANRLFRKNALELSVGDTIKIVDPQTGETMNSIVPSYDTICSNLPFVTFEHLQPEDKNLFASDGNLALLDGKSDLSYYIALHLASLLKDGGWLGLILSNAWLGTDAGTLFYKELIKLYDLKQVHISGNGRWFQNADIVTTLLILKKKSEEEAVGNTSFYVWKQPLEIIAANQDWENAMVNSSLLDGNLDETLMKRSSYTTAEIDSMKAIGLSYNVLFHEVRWLLDIRDCLIPITDIFSLIRGSRRGWDKMFFPKGKTGIEPCFLHPALFNARRIDHLSAAPDRLAFCCSEPLDILSQEHPGAYRWIKKFSTEKNGTGKPLPEVLKISKDEEWYEMKPKETAELFTMMNPDDRFFFGAFQKPTFINQRLIGLRFKNSETDKPLCHALLNSILQKFFIEANGFGRGLGVLDFKKEGVAKLFMLNPSLVSREEVKEIKTAFLPILNKPIMTIEEEIQDDDWKQFNYAVLRAYHLEGYYIQIANSLRSLRKVRKTAKAVTANKAIVASSDRFQPTMSEDYALVAEATAS